MSALNRFIAEALLQEELLADAIRQDHRVPPRQPDWEPIAQEGSSEEPPDQSIQTVAVGFVPPGAVETLVHNDFFSIIRFGRRIAEGCLEYLRRAVLTDAKRDGAFSVLDDRLREVTTAVQTLANDALAATEEGRLNWSWDPALQYNNAMTEIIAYAEALSQHVIDIDAESNQLETGANRNPKSWLGNALLLKHENPTWSYAKIAREVGVNKSTVSRDLTMKALDRMTRQQAGDFLKGHITIDPDTGRRDVVAIAPPVRNADDQPDRGKPIPGSKYFREYCAECGEPIKVARDKVGKKTVCEGCGD